MITFKYKLAATILFLLSATTMHTCLASSPRRPAPKKENTSKKKANSGKDISEKRSETGKAESGMSFQPIAKPDVGPKNVIKDPLCSIL